MALKQEHKKQILVMNNRLAKRFEKFLSALSIPVCAHTFFSFPTPAKKFGEWVQYLHPPPPPHGTSSEYIPHGFHFHKCSQLYRENRGSVNSYQQAQHFVSSIIYYQWYESLHREGGKIALQFVAHFAPLSLSLILNKLCLPFFSGYMIKVLTSWQSNNSYFTEFHQETM